MKSRGLNLNRDGKEMNLNNEYKGGDGLIDRSKVRILLCDNDSKSLKEAFTLLSECSYQVTVVRSARQVIDAINAEGRDIDIILAEVDLPMTKGMKMLKYITRDKDLHRIPVIMMSRKDEVSVVVKCLKLGAADYLVKPLRTNELLNLWTHMWRRRRMLGIAEKNILNFDFDLVASDPSDANTNSTTLFSDDTDDKTHRCTNPEGTSNHQENNSATAAVGAIDGSATSAAPAVAAMEPPPFHSVDFLPDVPGTRDRHAGHFTSGPKKSQLKIGESSAFFSYVKSAIPKTDSQGFPHVNENRSHHPSVEENLREASDGIHNTHQTQHENGEAWENYSQGDDFHSGTSLPNSLERSCTPPMSMEFHNKRNYQEENMNNVLINPRNNESSQVNVSGFSGPPAYPYYMHGVMNQVMMQQPSVHGHAHATSTMLPQYNHHFPRCPPHHPNGMSTFPYYHPMSISLQHGQISMVHPWSSEGNPSSSDAKLNKVDRREEALIKFRKKRKERCFDKKIRYVNRKKLAERRPRIRGQFVRKVNGVNVDLNGQPESVDYDEDEEEDDEQASRDSSPKDEALEP